MWLKYFLQNTFSRVKYYCILLQNQWYVDFRYSINLDVRQMIIYFPSKAKLLLLYFYNTWNVIFLQTKENNINNNKTSSFSFYFSTFPHYMCLTEEESMLFKRMPRLSWTHNITNLSILKALGVDKRLFSIRYHKILKIFAQDDNLKKIAVQGKVFTEEVLRVE